MAALEAPLSEAAIRAALTSQTMGQRVVYVDVATSTMDLASQEASAGAPEGTLVIAGAQTAGRGRHGRPWVSPPGAALYLSIILRPRADLLLQLNMIATLAIVRAVARTTGLAPRIKWPNDVQAGGKKLSGVLIDCTIEPGGGAQAIVGIGINVTLDPATHPEIASTATSLAKETGAAVAALPVLVALLAELEELYYRAQADESLLEAWRSHLDTLGRWVTVTHPGGPGDRRPAESGIAEDVDADGALLLRRQDGTLMRLLAGEVTLRG